MDQFEPEDFEEKLKEVVTSFSTDQWSGFLTHLLFQRTDDKVFLDLETLLLSRTDDPDLMFRALFHVTASDKRGPSHDYFMRSVIQLIKSMPVNPHNNLDLVFLIRFLKECRPINYRRDILKVLEERGDKLFGIRVDQHYTALHLLLDCYMTIVSRNDEAFENYLFVKTQTTNYPFFSGYLMEYYLAGAEYKKARTFLAGLLLPGHEERLYWVLLRAENNSYRNVSWKWTYLILDEAGLLKEQKLDTAAKRQMGAFIFEAAKVQLVQASIRIEDLPVEQCFLACMDHFFNDVTRFDIAELYSIVLKNSPPKAIYNPEMRDEIINKIAGADPKKTPMN